MGTVYERRRHQQQLLHHKTIFIPLFCRLSLKDINLSRRDSPPSDELSSPKVSCMGQVKKRNNRVTAAPTQNHNCSKLKKLFSAKALLPAAGSKSCRSGNKLVYDLRRLKVKKDCDAKVVDVGELDPPLPVLKKAAAVADEVNLWKRRFNGAALKTLQIQNSTNIVSVPPTV